MAARVGHNGGRTHGGDLLRANGKPNFLSVMSYMFQLHGCTMTTPITLAFPRSTSPVRHSACAGARPDRPFRRLGFGYGYPPAAALQDQLVCAQGPGTVRSAATIDLDGSARARRRKAAEQPATEWFGLMAKRHGLFDRNADGGTGTPAVL